MANRITNRHENDAFIIRDYGFSREEMVATLLRLSDEVEELRRDGNVEKFLENTGDYTQAVLYTVAMVTNNMLCKGYGIGDIRGEL